MASYLIFMDEIGHLIHIHSTSSLAEVLRLLKPSPQAFRMVA